MVTDEARVRLQRRTASSRAGVTWGVGIGSVAPELSIRSGSEFAAAFGCCLHRGRYGTADVSVLKRCQSRRRGAVR